MSMPAYGKSSQQQPQDYEDRSSAAQHISTSHQQNSYYPTTQYSRHNQPQRAPQVSHPHASSYQSHPKQSYTRSYDDMSIPTIVEYGPHSGMEGTMYTVTVESSTDLTNDTRTFRFLFGSFRCTASVSKYEEGRGNLYDLTTPVPSATLTGWISPQVIVYLVIEDEDGTELNTTQIGNFNYTDVAPAPVYSPTTNATRKRKLSTDAEDPRSPSKRPTSQPAIRPKGEDYMFSYPQVGVTGPSYTTPYPPQASPRSYQYPTTYPPATESHSQAIVAQHLPQWAASYSSNNQPPSIASTMAGQQVPSGPSKIAASMTSPQEAVPQLVRTSTLQSHQNPSGSGGSGSFNPYGMFPPTSKAILNIEGDLDTVATSTWTPEELETKRKLVRFRRSQKGATINASFSVVSANDREPNSICISCIYWAEKQECYVTSVDCIYLLESLISVRFTVEEKNRIRRNLEGFRPMTVSKAKADSENFFKLIMQFPNPKPRNIEKDVKVFPWKILSMALKKIIGKYSASYSSTAAVLPPGPPPNAYASPVSNDVSNNVSDNHNILSSPTVASPTSSSGLGGSLGPSLIKHQPKMENSNNLRHKGPGELSGPPLNHNSIPTNSNGPQVWQQSHHQTSPSHMKPPGNHWSEVMGYVDTPTGVVNSTSQSLHYQRGSYTNDKRDGNHGPGHQQGHIQNNAP